MTATGIVDRLALPDPMEVSGPAVHEEPEGEGEEMVAERIGFDSEPV